MALDAFRALLCIHLFQKRLSERTADGNLRTEIIRPKGTVGLNIDGK